ncbi:extracellular solute-binding protein, partial [Thioclava sp. BHET1]
NIIFSMLLAQHHYHQKDLAKTILGSWQNPKQIFDESSILARLESGQMDATSGYLASVVSQGLPYIKLSDATNLSDPAVIKANADKIHVTIKDHDGKPEALDMEPLVYYAGVLANAKHPKEAAEFVTFLQTPAGQKLLRADGYSAPKGGDLK